ncbi:substrate-binding and VWA domain-containing protein [Spongiactinospora rosea]|uniref:substrate-binding and VWA domain-containing protein n=1 Tax=Spongiactinospora rosea TaxID=2248750 RepID=UPI001313E126|nr:substrate-binding and VWA domain-containing protein [Spongiactinospora rosea]
MVKRQRSTRTPARRRRPDPRTQWPDQVRVWPPDDREIRPPRPPQDLPILSPEEFLPPPRRGRGRAAVAASVVVMALTLATGGVWAVMGPADCAAADRVRVTAAPEIAPVLRALAERDADRTGCAQVSVRAGRSYDVAAALAAGEPGPDVWVPESSGWAGLAATGGAPARVGGVRGPSVARTPVILAVRQARAGRLAAAAGRPTWNMMSAGGRLSLRVPDPRRWAVGQAVLGLGDLAKDVSALRAAIVPDPAAALEVLGGDAGVAAVTTEQRLFTYNAAEPEVPASGIYPEEGAVSLDHPYLVLTEDRTRRATALVFQDTVTSAEGRRAVRQAGFRDGEGRAGAGVDEERGLRAQEPPRLAPLPVARAARALDAIGEVTAPVRVLMLVDTSWSMRRRVPGTAGTRAALAGRLVREGIGVLPEGSSVGIWRFAHGLDGGRPYREVLEIGPVTGRSAKIRAASAGLATGVGGRAGLRESVLAAYREAVSHASADEPGLVVLITDGGPDSGSLGLDELVAALGEESDAKRPVAIAAVGFGPDAGRAELTRIAAATGGRAYLAGTVPRARQAIRDAVTRRPCAVECRD